MHRRLQFGMRENPASSRRHGSRPALNTRSNENYNSEENQASPQLPASDDPKPIGAGGSPHAASHQGATGGGRLNENRLLTVQEVAGLLQVPASWVYEHTRLRCADRMPGFRVGKYWRFAEEDVTAWLATKRRKDYRHAG